MSRVAAVAQRVGAGVAKVRAEGFSPRQFRAICIASLVSLCAIGAAVRLTGSGLGCSDWPRCSDTAFVDVSSKHSAIEQINRLFTFVVGLAVVLAAVAAYFRRPRRRDLTLLSVAIVLGVPAQGLVGAIVVWTHLHPATVQLHFVLSMVLVALAVVMLIRSSDPDGGRRILSVLPRTQRRVRTVVVWTALAILAGTIVTATGTHAGDEDARRFFGSPGEVDGRALQWVTRAHSLVVWITVAMALGLVWHLRKRKRDRKALDLPLTVWFCLAIAQGGLGYLQYATGVPAALVAAHVFGATALWGVSVWLWCSTSRVSLSANEQIAQSTSAA
jgi:heme a synthase